jgi:hypothetical protein
MRHTWLVLLLGLAGCSTHPVADVMDFFRPGRIYANEVQPYGGICGPQGAVLLPGVEACPTVMPPAAPVPPAPGLVPPAVPLPPSTGATPPPFPR